MTDIAFPLVENEAIKNGAARAHRVLLCCLMLYVFILISSFGGLLIRPRSSSSKPISFGGGTRRARWRLELLEEEEGRTVYASIEEELELQMVMFNALLLSRSSESILRRQQKRLTAFSNKKIIYYTITITGRRQWRRFLMKSSPVRRLPFRMDGT